MGKLKSFALTGTMGNIVFYQVGNNTFTRTLPSRVRQSKATKESSKSFGEASRMCRLIREELAFMSPEHKGVEIRNKITAALIEWRRQKNIEKPAIRQMELYPGFSLRDTFSDQLKVEWHEGFVRVRLPVFVPAHALRLKDIFGKVTLKVFLLSCDFRDDMSVIKNNHTLLETEDFQTEFSGTDLQFPLDPGAELTLVVVTMEILNQLGTVLKRAVAFY